jgi:hypothetical protein
MAIQVQVVMDAADPAAQAEFWARALDYVVQPPPPGFASWDDFADKIGLPLERRGDQSAVVDPAGRGPRVYFQRVPEGKQVKNRVRVDVQVGAPLVSEPDKRWVLVEQHVAKLVESGATVLYENNDVTGRCMVMQDPEGNEFCVA